MRRVLQVEAYIGTQVYEVAGTHGERSLNVYVVAELLHAFGYIRLHVALLLYVLCAPADVVLAYRATFHVEIEVCATQTHCSGKCHGLHCAVGAADESLWGGYEPCAAALG